ncbi:MAG: suppressor of fused domain protein [Planctomycetota bacterium]
MDLKAYKTAYPDPDHATPGWEAIENNLKRIYGDQEPKHWGTILPGILGGDDPIDGISAYACHDADTEHLHFVTYGYTDLYYDEESVGGDYSGFGFEMTFRLKGPTPARETEDNWVCSLFQNLARYVFQSGNVFDQYHWVPANGPIHLDSDTDIVGLAFVYDPVLQPLDSPHGRVDFVQAFGITQSELDMIKSKTKSPKEIIEEHRETNPLLITDLNRKDRV